MTTLISEMAGLKPRRDSDALNAKSRLMLPRVEPSETLTAKLLVTQKSDAEQSVAKEPEVGGQRVRARIIQSKSIASNPIRRL